MHFAAIYIILKYCFFERDDYSENKFKLSRREIEVYIIHIYTPCAVQLYNVKCTCVRTGNLIALPRRGGSLPALFYIFSLSRCTPMNCTRPISPWSKGKWWMHKLLAWKAVPVFSREKRISRQGTLSRTLSSCICLSRRKAWASL